MLGLIGLRIALPLLMYAGFRPSLVVGFCRRPFPLAYASIQSPRFRVLGRFRVGSRAALSCLRNFLEVWALSA